MLLYILFFLLVILVLLPTILISIVRSVLSIFGLNFKRRSQHKNDTRKNGASFTGGAGTKSSRDGHRKKIFDKDDGEYVDFEEIK